MGKVRNKAGSQDRLHSQFHMVRTLYSTCKAPIFVRSGIFLEMALTQTLQGRLCRWVL
jgi:hypothetical protein